VKVSADILGIILLHASCSTILWGETEEKLDDSSTGFEHSPKMTMMTTKTTTTATEWRISIVFYNLGKFYL
jgi:hypothetical protein